MNKNKGFTLIELLVVIAIIGILSGIVLTSLGSARNKAKDASAKGSLSSMRAQAEIYYDNLSSYSGVCAASETESGLADLKAAVDKQVPSSAPSTCDDDEGAWAAEVTLNSGDLFCVDSSGFSNKPSASKGAATVCTR